MSKGLPLKVDWECPLRIAMWTFTCKTVFDHVEGFTDISFLHRPQFKRLWTKLCIVRFISKLLSISSQNRDSIDLISLTSSSYLYHLNHWHQVAQPTNTPFMKFLLDFLVAHIPCVNSGFLPLWLDVVIFLSWGAKQNIEKTQKPHAKTGCRNTILKNLLGFYHQLCYWFKTSNCMINREPSVSTIRNTRVTNTESKHACSLNVWTLDFFYFFYLLLTSTSAEHQHKPIGQNVCASCILVSNSQLRFRGVRRDHWGLVYRVEQRLPWFQKCFRHNLMEMLGSFINTHQRLTCTLEHIANILA